MHMGLTAQIKAFIMIYGPFPLIDAGFNWRYTSPSYHRWKDLSELWTHTIHEMKRT